MSHSKQISRKHHFIPKFYLETWYESKNDGFWLYTRNPKGELYLRRRHAKSVLFVENLYTINPELPGFQHSSDELERNFFAPIDNSSSLVHQKLITKGLSSVTHEERCVWAMFLNSIIYRNPNYIREIEHQFPAEEILANFHAQNPYSNPSKVLKNINLNALARNSILSLIIKHITDNDFIRNLATMKCQTVDISNEQDHFLTSDSLLILNLGRPSQPILLLSIALSPTRLLIICENAEQFDLEFIKILAATYNILLVKQTQKYLISSRQITDTNHIKNVRIINEMLCK
jgi:hypothetical protein